MAKMYTSTSGKHAVGVQRLADKSFKKKEKCSCACHMKGWNNKSHGRMSWCALVCKQRAKSFIDRKMEEFEEDWDILDISSNQYEKLKSFIKSTLISQKKEIIKRLPKKRYNAEFNGQKVAYMTDDWYNQAIDEVLKILKDL